MIEAALFAAMVMGTAVVLAAAMALTSLRRKLFEQCDDENTMRMN